MNQINVAHLFSSFQSLGGVQSILRKHKEVDGDFGVSSRFMVSHEPEIAPLDDGVQFLKIDGDTKVSEARRRLEIALNEERPECAVYQYLWGMTFFADSDGAARRILVQHGQIPNLERMLHKHRHSLDGVICNGESVRSLVRRVLPEMSEDRVTLLHYPISPPADPSPLPEMSGRPIVLGFCGRLSVHQKRVDRMPRLFEELDRLGVSYRMEFLGEGPEQSWLEEQFPDRSKFVFHGMLQGRDYWKVMEGWDVIAFTSDFEGTPISMLEAMSLGVLPLYPRIDSGAEPYVSSVDPRLLYSTDDFKAAAAAVKAVGEMSPTEYVGLRQAARKGVEHHTSLQYFDEHSQFVRRILELPRISEPNPGFLPFPLSLLNFDQLEQIGNLRRNVQSFFRGKK